MFQCLLGKITRNIALNRYDYNRTAKRSPEFESTLNEYFECALGKEFDCVEELIFKNATNDFLANLKKRERIIFLQRYWYFLSVAEIAKGLGLTQNNVKVILHRVRDKLRQTLYKEGIFV